MAVPAGAGQGFPGPFRKHRHPKPHGCAERRLQQLDCLLTIGGLVAGGQQAGQVGSPRST
jgi:hypothetical protein